MYVTFCLIVALVLFILAALPKVQSASTVSLGWAGAAFLTVAVLLGHGLP